MKKDYIEEVAARIIDQLKQGTAPWVRPWEPGAQVAPYNQATGKPYRGMNNLLLTMSGHADPRWMTYRQAAEMGGQVRKGEKGTQLHFWKFEEERAVRDDAGRPVLNEDGTPKVIKAKLETPRSFPFFVFNAAQIDGLPPLEPRISNPEPARHERAEAILKNSGATIHHIAGDRAYYRPGTDSITLPERGQFKSPDSYYATALHELGHWTGHPSRLDRDLSNPFGSEAYAREELRAEIGSYLLGERLEIGHDPGQHMAYIGSWIKTLQEDPREIFRAAADAERIVQFVTGFEHEQVREQDQQQKPSQEAFMQTTPEATEKRDAVELWALMHVEQGTIGQALENASLEQIDRALDVLDRMQPMNTQNEFWTRHELPYDPEPLEAKINEAMDDLLENVRPAAAEAAQSQGVAGSPLNAKYLVFNEDTLCYREDGTPMLGVLASAPAGRGWMNGPFLPQPEDTLRAATTADFDRFRVALPSDYAIQAIEPVTVSDQRPPHPDAFFYLGGQILDWNTAEPKSPDWTGLVKSDSGALFYVGQDNGERSFTVLKAKNVEDGRREIAAIVAAGSVDRIVSDPPENPAPDRVYLAVPYREKEQAKAAAKTAGFKLGWDADQKKWYAPGDADLSAFGRWRADAAHVEPSLNRDAVHSQFADAIRDAGLKLEGWPVMDGQIQRVPVDGDKGGEKSGAYSGHLEGRTPGGYIQNFKTGEVVNWKPAGPVASLTPTEAARLELAARAAKKKSESEQTERHAKAAAAAAALWVDSPAAGPDNPYLQAKGITAAAGLRVVPETVRDGVAAMGIRIAATTAEAKAMREAEPEALVFKTGDLLIPGRDADGKLWTLQTVNPAFKGFIKGGRKAGVMTIAGDDPEKPLSEIFQDPSRPLVLAEGYATAETVARLTGQPVVVAFDSGNLDAVARELRERFPGRPMIFAADNDHAAAKETLPNGKPRPNVGMEKAQDAARRHGGAVVAPPFRDGEQGSDWNDFRANRGEEEAKRLLAEQLAAAKIEAAISAERLTSLARERNEEVQNDPTTSADDAMVARERGKAAGVIVSASEQNSNVQSAADDALADMGRGAGPAAAAVAGISNKLEVLQEDTKRERQEVQNNPQPEVTSAPATGAQAARGRGRRRGYDAGL